MRKLINGLIFVAVCLFVISCGGFGDSAEVVIYPDTVNVVVNQTQQFEGFVKILADPTVRWKVDEGGGGTISAQGLYTAPSAPGVFHVIATSNSDSSLHHSATVTVVASP